MADSKAFKISRLAQWRIDSFGPSYCKKSEPFNVGLWNRHLSVERNRYLNIRLFPEPSKVYREQPLFARFILRVSDHGLYCKPYASTFTRDFFELEKTLFGLSMSVFGADLSLMWNF